MRYIGNKSKLLPFIESTMKKHNIEGEVFADLFAGTGSVGDYFKEDYTIVSNDFLYYSHVFSKAKLSNSKEPDFKLFYKKFGTDPFTWFNSRIFFPDEHYFIYQNYSPKGDRKFFSEENAIKIDGIRIGIENLYQEETITDNEYYYLLASLLESVTKVSNTSGTYEAFFDFWESRAVKPLILSPLDMHESSIISKNNQIYNEDTNKLVREISGDIAYIDTPYTITQYASAYHILETIASYDFPKIAGKTGRRQENRQMSEYSRKRKAKDSFEDLFRQLNFKHILISYSNQSLVPLDELVHLAENFATDGKVFVDRIGYREYKNLNASKKGGGKKLEEVLIYFKKETHFNKSPLNYSGSKDTQLRRIYSELPMHVGTFIDMMGGAFNVGSNVVVTDKVIYNEYNPFVYEIIEMLLTHDKEDLINEMRSVINKFNLSKGNKESYIEFRKYYNKLEKTSFNLFILHLFSFQNMIRFNQKHEFNTPVGNAGFTQLMVDRIHNFRPHAPQYELSNKDFRDFTIKDIPQDAVFFFDPPYLITTADYNDGKRGFDGWNADAEASLLSYIHTLDKLGYKFMLTNVIEHKGKTNYLLKEWSDLHNYTVVEIGSTGSRYPRVEVLIKNY